MTEDRFSHLTLDTATKADIEAYTEDIRCRGHSLNLMVPATPSNVGIFLKTFACDHCGECCKGQGDIGGGVALAQGEPRRLAELKTLSPRRFRDRYCFTEGSRLLLRYPCPFHLAEARTPLSADEGRCSIYTKRPFMCHVYPLQEPQPLTLEDPLTNGIQCLTLDPSCHVARELVVAMLLAKQHIRKLGLGPQLEPLAEAMWAAARRYQLGLEGR